MLDYEDQLDTLIRVTVLLLSNVTTLKMARKPVKLPKENPAGCAGNGKQSKGKEEKRGTV